MNVVFKCVMNLYYMMCYDVVKNKYVILVRITLLEWINVEFKM